MAGFSPCPRTNQVAVTLDPATANQEATNFGTQAIKGFEGGASTFSGDFPAAGDRVADSDAFISLRGGDQSYTVTAHNPAAAEFKVLDATGLEEGDVLMVCDANNTAILQTSNTTIASGSRVHNSGVAGIVPGNCTKGLGYPVPNPCTALGTPYGYDTDAQIIKMVSTIYYVGVSQSGTSRSLYRRRLNVNTAGILGPSAPVELIDGLESMQIIYGLDTNGDTLANEYVTADVVDPPGAPTPDNWNNVVSVRIALLTHTPDTVASADDTNTYYLAGTQFDDTDHGNDKRLRQIYTSTIKIRNRGEQ
jgi:type IV pilus assembly protein PilW